MAIEKGWSTDSTIMSSDLLSELLEKFEWDVFPATYNNYDRAPREAGIYIFSGIKNINLENTTKTLSTPIYIGISDYDMSVRYFDHRSKPWFNDGNKCFGRNFTYSFYIVDPREVSKRKLEEWETYLMKAFGPQINKQYSYSGDDFSGV